MNYLAFTIIAWVLLGLEHGLRNLLRIGADGAYPSFILALIVAAGLGAPGPVAMWTALLLGLLTDLLNQVALASTSAEPGALRTILGPHALGFLLAMRFILTMRPLVNRRNPLTFAVLAAGGCLIITAIITLLFSVRSIFGDSVAFSARGELFRGLGSAVYTGLAGAVLSLALIPLSGFLGLGDQTQKRRR